jgi:outer membrane protein assembly factor BamB
VWKNPDFDTHHGGYVLLDKTIYGSNWINNNQGNWIAIDWTTGETKYNTAWEGKGKGSIIASDEMLYCYDERRGTLGLVNPTSDKFEVVSEFRITKGEGPYWTHPVIKNGILYIRHGSALMAFNIKDEK